MLKTDTHLHSFFSSDSETPMESMVLSGIQKGFSTLCFTEHYDPDFPCTPDGMDFQLDFDAYEDTFLLLKDKYADQIELLHGIELGVQKHVGPALEEFYASKGSHYDFIINSCHLVDGMDPYEPAFFAQRSSEDALRAYFEHILVNLNVFPHFQTAGHLDYICRYIHRYFPGKLHFLYRDYADILDEILRLLIAEGKALEVNSAGLKAGLAWPNPHMEILKRYRQLGGELITIGSDAHRPEDLGYAFDRLPDILSAAGFQYYALYRGQKPSMIALK